jgi:hypothetical protein
VDEFPDGVWVFELATVRGKPVEDNVATSTTVPTAHRGDG